MKQPKYSTARRLARQLGLSRNPLYRPVDRVDGAVRLGAVLLLLIVVAISLWGGMAAFARTSAAAARERQQSHQVPVVLTEDVPTGGAWAGVAALWTRPDGSVRAGTVYVNAMAHRGDSLSVPMNAVDDPVAPSTDHDNLLVLVALQNLVWATPGGVVLWLSYQLAQRQLARRRDAAWTTEWLLVSGGWRNHST